MDGMLRKILPKETPAKKLQKEIKATEFKKQSLLSAVQTEIREAAGKRDGILRQIGRIVYERRDGGGLPEETFAAHFAEIGALDTQIGEKEVKSAEIGARYDEELLLLKAQLAALDASPPVEAPSFCGHCGQKFTPGVDIFCSECGQKAE